VPSALWQFAAVVVATAHLAVVLFVIGGGFVVRGRRPLLWAHLTTVTAVVTVAAFRVPCPLTEIELWLRELGGVDTYRGGFVEHYLVRPVYSPGLIAPAQVVINVVAIATNLVAYGRMRSTPRLGTSGKRRDVAQSLDLPV